MRDKILKIYFKNRRACLALQRKKCMDHDARSAGAKKGLFAAPKAAGCERFYRERVSGGYWDRLEWHRLLDQFRNGDMLVRRAIDLAMIRNIYGNREFERYQPVR